MRRFRNGVLLALAAVSALAFADPSKLPQPEFKQVVVAGGALVTGTVDTNTALGALSTVYTKRVTRLGATARGDSPPTDYIASASACSLNSGNGDGMSQVKSADNKCWLAEVATVAPALSTAFYDEARTNGWFISGDNKAATSQVLAQSEVQALGGVEGFRDALFVHHRDSDTTNYQPSNSRKVSNGLRVMATGAYASNIFQSQTKDIVALDAHAIARVTGWDARGVTGVAAGAIQYGSGVGSNEFAVQNPTFANEQSVSMAGVQAILRNQFAASDGSHLARGVLVTSDQSFLSTAAFEAYSAPHPSISARDSAFAYGLSFRNATIATAAIVMPQSRPGTDSGTVIEYDANDYTDFIRATNTYRWIAAGGVKLLVSDVGVGFNGSAPTGKCTLSAALPTDGSATSAAMATAINAIRTCLVTNGLGQ